MAPAKPLALGLVVFVLSLLPATALGQGGTSGSIVGYVYDQTGNPIKGVKASATSPTQIGGAQVGYTNDEGQFRIRQLFPGTFEVRLTAPRLKTVVQKDVRVGITASAEVNMVMEVEAAGIEEVKVVEKAPLVSTTKANLKETYDLDFVEATPHVMRDNIWRQLIAETPGGIGDRIRGSTASQTLMTQDGFFMRGQYPVLKAAAAFEIQSGGYGADNIMASGGMVNVVTRTGSNQWVFELNAESAINELVFFRDATDADAGMFFHVIAPAISGPIIKDKLWFAFATETHLLHNTNNLGTHIDRGRDPLGEFPDPLPADKFIQKGTFKLTWQAAARNKISSVTNFDFPHEWNMINGQGVSWDAQQERQGVRLFQGLIWESLLSDTMVWRTQVGGTAIPQHLWPNLCNTDPNCDHVPSVEQRFPRRQLYGNNNNHQRDDLWSIQFQNRFDWFLSTRSLGEHNVQIKDDFYAELETKRLSRPGDQLTIYNGPDPESQTQYFSNDPRFAPERRGWFITETSVRRHITTLVDSWRPTRHLTLSPGINHAWASASNSQGDDLGNLTTFTPTFSVAWDATRDGRTVLRGSLNQYVDVDMVNIARHSLGTQAQVNCKWDPGTQTFSRDCVWSGGRSATTFGRPCGPSGIDDTGNDCRQTLEIPRTWEFTAGAEREVTTGLAVAVDMVYKKFTHLPEVNETNQVWNDSGTEVSRVGGYRDGRSQKVQDLSTPAGATRDYRGVTVGVTKREGAFRLRGTYTLSQLEGTVWSDLNNPWGDNPGRDVYLDGPLPDDHRHEIKLNLVYQATRWLSLGVMYNYYSGLPYNRLFRNDQNASFEDYRARLGYSPGANINDPSDDRELRYPDQQDVNAQVRVSLQPLIGQDLKLYANILNVFALRTTTGVIQNDTPEFGTTSGRMPPFRVRLGIEYRY